MNKGLKIKLGFCVFLTLISIWLLCPTFWSLANPDKAHQPPSWMPNTAMKLGLDLQGGVHMVMGVDLDKVVADQLTSTGNQLRKSLEKDGITTVTTKTLPATFELDIVTNSAEEKEKVSAKLQKEFSILEVVGDTGNTLVARLVRAYDEQVRRNALDQSIETIRNRIDEFGVAEPILSRKGDNQILVQFPGATESARLKSLIGQTAKLSFQIVHEAKDPGALAKQQADLEQKIQDAEKTGNYNRDGFKTLSQYRNKINEDLAAKLPPDTTIAFEKVRDINVNGGSHLRPFLLSTKNVLGGEYIESAVVQMEGGGGRTARIGPDRPVVSFSMNAAGAPLLGNLTTEFIGHYMAIVLDGVVRSAPVIQSAITGGSGQITLGTGGLDEMNQEARDLAIVLRAGALPANIEVQEERVIGPSIGKDAIEAGRKSLLIASGLIFAFMWLYYGASGFVAVLVTAVNIALIFGILGVMGATLTLAGIAGIVLTIGISVDALIIIFERMREEIRLGHRSRKIVELGFDHAFATILDSNVTTIIGALILYEYGSGSIRGFALTLMTGIIVNVFMATFFCKTLFEVFVRGQNEMPGIGISTKEITKNLIDAKARS